MNGIAKSDWALALKRFTDRNAGYRTALEIDDPALGAQEQEQGFELRGVAYDSRDDRVEIMLGRLGTVESHLTHTITQADELEIESDAEGRDRSLRIRRGDAQTLLRLVRS